MAKPTHQPVLLESVLEYLAPQATETYLDLTAGLGGHAAGALKAASGKLKLILVDRDPAAVKELRQRFKDARVIESDFLAASKQLIQEGIRADMVLLDLGVSSLQLDNPERGFSFKQDGPLNMRMDSGVGQTAQSLVNGLDQVSLANLIYRYGEEHRSRRIAKAIVEARPLVSTAELAAVVERAVGGRRGRRIHPATKTFQALRLAVNQELEQLEAVLPLLPKLLKPGSRLVVISFHSLEDRIAKQFLKNNPNLEVQTKKPLAGNQFDVSNRRARSAKLRAAKVKQKLNSSIGETTKGASNGNSHKVSR